MPGVDLIRVPRSRKIRLHANAKVLSFKRNHHVVTPHTFILEIEDCASREEAQYYLGKTVEYGKKRGKVISVHGNSGKVKAKFNRNLCPTAFGKRCKVMMY